MHVFLLVGLLRTRRWQRTRCAAGVSIEPAPPDLIEIEPGERCVKALWATDDDGVLLAAGALVERENDFDLWLGDSSDPSVGPNQQLRGAIPLALKLLVAFLAIETPATQLRAVPPPPPPRKRLADPLGGVSSASEAALAALGFVMDEDEDRLVLDDREAPAQLTTLAVDGGEQDAVRALRLIGARRDWPLRDDDDRCRVVPKALSLEEVAEFRAAVVQFSDGEDSVDGLPERHAMLDGALGARALEIGARIADIAQRDDLVPAAAFLRRYDSGDDTGRSALGPHFDAPPTVATAVVDLDPIAYEGGGYFVQPLPHCSSRRILPFSSDGRDACLHNAELIHGVSRVSGIRTSLVVWYHRSESTVDADDDDPDVQFAKAAAAGNSLFLHRAAAAGSGSAFGSAFGSANAHALLGSNADARGDERSAIEDWTAATLVGHASAADALADALESDVWREIADVDPFVRRQV